MEKKSKVFFVTVDDTYLPIAKEENGIISIINSFIMLLMGDIPLYCPDDTEYKTVKDLQVKLSNQTLSKPTIILREDVDTNELD